MGSDQRNTSNAEIESLLDKFYRQTGNVGLWNTNLYTKQFIKWLIIHTSISEEEKLNSADMKWYSIKEKKLPDKYTTVQVFARYKNGNGAYGIGYYSYDSKEWDIEWSDDVGGYSSDAITHWMPRPEEPPFPVEYHGVNITCDNPEKLEEIKKKIDTWVTIHEDKKCPKCNADDSMLMGPSAGISFNIICEQCGSRFWTTGYKAMGAEVV